MSKTTIIYRDVAPGASEDAAFTSGSATEFSTLDLSPENTSVPIATCELNAWSLDGSFVALGDQTVPFWSAALSGEDCVFETPPVIEIALDQQYTSVGLTLFFGADYCRKLQIQWYQQTTLKAEALFYPTGVSHYCQNNVESFDRVVITLLETSLPYRRAKLERIMFGVIRTFDMTEIRSAKVTNQMSHLAAELPVCTLNWTLDSHDDVNYIFQRKQPVEARNDDFLIGVYYITEHSRTAGRLYSLQCQDAIGVLDGSPFSGGVYSGQSAMALLEAIVGEDFPIYYENVSDTALTGVILAGTKRSAIQQILFAWGVCAATDGTDGIRVFSLPETPVEIGRDRTYVGASVNTSALVTSVRVTAHVYTQSSTGGVEINGVKYEDTRTVYTVDNPDVTASDKQNVVEITGATLVAPAIAQATAQRVYDFYSKRNTARAKVVWRGELLGDCVTVPNAWNGANTGHIEKSEMTLSNTVAASLEVTT